MIQVKEAALTQQLHNQINRKILNDTHTQQSRQQQLYKAIRQTANFLGL
jgi:heme exporter protein D